LDKTFSLVLLLVHFYFTKNKKSNAFLKAMDDVIWNGDLAAGNDYTATFIPLDGDLPAGVYSLYLQNADGSSSSYILSAKDKHV
jgi:hypothetical protein